MRHITLINSVKGAYKNGAQRPEIANYSLLIAN